MTTSASYKDAALASVLSTGRWLVLLTAAPASLTAPAVFAVRFPGVGAAYAQPSVWGSPTGGQAARQRTNTVEIGFGSVAGLVNPTDATHYAVVSTSDGNPPNPATSFANVSDVVEANQMTRTIRYTNGATPRFPPGTFVVVVADPT